MEKTAFFTMDTESYYDTSCVRESDLERTEQFSCKEQIKDYYEILNKNDAKATFLVTGEFISESKEYLQEAVKIRR